MAWPPTQHPAMCCPQARNAPSPARRWAQVSSTSPRPTHLGRLARVSRGPFPWSWYRQHWVEVTQYFCCSPGSSLLPPPHYPAGSRYDWSESVLNSPNTDYLLTRQVRPDPIPARPASPPKVGPSTSPAGPGERPTSALAASFQVCCRQEWGGGGGMQLSAGRGWVRV